MFDRLLPAALTDGAVQHLRDAGVLRGSVVGWLGDNSWDMVATLVACQRLGAVLMPLDGQRPAGALAWLLQHAGAGHLLGTPEMAQRATEVLTLAPLRPGPAEGVLPGDLLLVDATGRNGTDGQPKAAMHTAASLQAGAVAAIAAQGLSAASRVLAVLPLCDMSGLCVQTLPALAAGARVSLQARFEAAAWYDAVEQWRPTTTVLVPAMMQALVQHPRWAGADLSSLSFVCASGRSTPRALIDAFHARGVPMARAAGTAETGPVSLVLRPDEALAHPGLAGRPALGMQLRLAAGGDVLLKGAALMRGYHRHSQPAFDAEGWFHTGDVAVQHPDGLLELVGRSPA